MIKLKIFRLKCALFKVNLQNMKQFCQFCILSTKRNIIQTQFERKSKNSDRIMTTQIDQTTNAIKSEIVMIEENRKHRNQIYQACMDNYIANLKKQIQQLQSTEAINVERNKNISSAFETVYDKIITSANITLRKIKQTSYEKKVFWDNLIKNNAQLNSIAIKKQFYLQKRDAQDRFYDTIDEQNNKKIPYSVLLGKNKKKQELKEWKEKNRAFEEKVQRGTATLNQWQNTWQRNATERENYYRPTTQVYENTGANNFIRNQKTSSNQIFPSNYEQNYNTNNMTSPLYEVSGNTSEFGFLKNFERKKK